MSGDGELMMTISHPLLEENRSISENVRWRVKKRYEKEHQLRHSGFMGIVGRVTSCVIPSEAAIVIFQNFYDGKSRLETERGIYGGESRQGTVASVTDSISKDSYHHYEQPFTAKEGGGIASQTPSPSIEERKIIVATDDVLCRKYHEAIIDEQRSACMMARRRDWVFH